MTNSSSIDAYCFPLTTPQREIWFDQLLHSDEPLYNIGGYMHLDGPLDVGLFTQSAELLVRKHDVLRTVFCDRQEHIQADDALPMQTFAGTLPVKVVLRDFSSEVQPHESAMAWMQQRFSEPFMLQGEPLFRYALLKLGSDSFLYFACYHHLIADGWTIALLARSHAELYTALATGETPDIAAPSYVAFAENDRSYSASPAFATQRQYWLQKFHVPPEPLFVARYRSQVLNHATPSQCSTLSLPRAWYNRLSAFARQHGATTFHAILAAVYVYFTRTAQRTELVVGLPVLNRANAAFKATAGLFVGVTAARFCFDMDLCFSELLQAIGRELKQDYRSQRFPVSTLNRDLGRVESAQPQLFDIGVSYERHNYHAAFGQTRGMAIPLVNDHQTIPLMLYVREFHEDEAVQVDFVYNKAYFTGDEITAIGQRLVHLLDAAEQMPDAPVGAMPVMTEDEAHQLLSWNRTQRDYPAGTGLLYQYSMQVKKQPDRVAVVIGDQQLSYRQLDDRANRLARYLQQLHGLAPDTLVGLCMERSPEMIIGMLGILKAGGAYVPLNPAYPAHRLQRMMEDAQMPVLLTQKRLISQLPQSQAALVCLDTDWDRIAACSDYSDCGDDIDDHAVAANLAYVIYTSGSTGVPKGVMVSRGNLLHSTLARIHAYEKPVERFLMLSSFAFDSSVAGIFWTLCEGGTLCLPFEHEHNDATVLVRLIERHAASHLLCIPSFHALLLDTASHWQLASLSAVIVAGEVCGAELVERHYAMLPNTALFNEYGPTEGSVWSTVHRCMPHRQSTHVPIGKPIDNVQIYLLDRHLEPVPVGVSAEMYIAGEGVARGYLGNPDTTADKFLPCPFSDKPGARMYQSGDVGRWLPDGTIEYLGRRDHQVKIRGFRIELSEIEAALLAQPLVREVAVLAREDHPGDQRLVAYVVMHDHADAKLLPALLPNAADPEPGHVAEQLAETKTVSVLKEALATTLPLHMAPDHFVVLTQMPLTTNGKIDRKALPSPHLRRSQRDYIAPSTRTERMLADIWGDLFKCERIGIHDNFFTLGGHSLLAIRLVSGLRKLTGVELPLRAIFEAPVLHALAQRVNATLHHGIATEDQRNTILMPGRADRKTTLPLSFAQQRLWFLDQLETGNAFYNMAGGVRLTGMLDAAALEAAINDIVVRHEVLRTAFEVIDDSAVQVIAAHAPVPFIVTNLSHLPAQARLAEAQRLAELEAAHAFDLTTAPMLRVHLLRLDAQEHRLLLSLHHIAADGWSMAILMREIAVFYNGHASKTPAVLPALPLQYADFAAWQRTLPSSAQWERELGYWRQQLAGAPALLALPTDHARPALQSYRGAHVGFTLPDALAAGLHALGRENGATLFMTLLSAFGVLLARYSAQDDICIGTPIANRRHAEFEGMIGCFVNTLVLRLKLDDNPRFAQLLRQMRETALAAYAHQDIPFEQLVDALQPERDLSHAPLFQVMFVLHNNATLAAALDGLVIDPLHIDLPIAKFDLTLNMWEDADRLHGNIEYSTDLFERATIKRMIGHIETLLTAIVERPDTPVAGLDMLTPQERRFLLDDLNRLQHDFPLETSYATLFAEQVARHPERIAAVCMHESFTYRELDVRSTRIAHALIAAGAGPNTLVGTIGERSLCFVTMLIAIVKAGAAYVPLDVTHPVQRLREIVALGPIPLLLVSESSLPLLDQLLSGLANVPLAPLALVAERCWLDGDTSTLPPIGSPDDLAYVIFTSGSTGQPKGAMVERKGMLNNLYGKVPALGLNSQDRVAQTASAAFDISVWQFLAAPLLGGSVHIMPDQVAHDPQRLLDEVAAQQVSVLQVVPSMMRHLVDVPVEHLAFSLRWVLSIGEALPPVLAQAWFARFPAIPLINIYGPAECADNVAFLAVHDAQEAQAFHALASVPIGRPTANTQLFVLDAHWQPVPVGVPGEICIAGAGVGRGYLNDPETSAKVFVDHPFQPGARFYRTGDRGRYRPDGTLDYLGRRDHQIKIRGQRIELGEIESRLRSCSGVRDAVVIGRKDQAVDIQIIAYWAPQADTGMAAIDADTLRRQLSHSLPHSMIPAHFVMLDQLPVNPNGKVDRKALAALPWQAEERQPDAPSTADEERLQVIWSALLGQAAIGRDENFFHLGGHSLLATQVMSQIRKVFDVELPLRAIFEAPTMRALALRIEQAQQAMHPGEPALLPVERSDVLSLSLPLSFSQQRLWFLNQLEPGSALYNMPGSLRLTGALDTVSMEAALNDIVARHDVLRTAFDTMSGETVQRITTGLHLPLVVHDLSKWEEPQRETEARRLAAAEAVRPFDLRTAPLLRAQLLRLDAHEHWLLLTLHHIAADGWSIGILMRELAAFYHARLNGVAPVLPVLPVQYADFAVWQRARLQGPTRERQLSYWRAQLDGALALLDLPTDHPRPAVQSYRGAHCAVEIAEPLTADLHALCRRTQTTLFMTLSSAFALLLGRYSGQNDICIGTPVANRQRHEVEDLIGFFVNTLVLRFRLNGAQSFPQLLHQTHEMALAAYGHQDMPFEQLVEALQPERHLNHSPLFQVMFVLQNTPVVPLALDGLQVESLDMGAPSIAKFDLTLHVTEQDGRLQAAFEFNADLFERDSIMRLSQHFHHLLHAIVAQPDAAIAELPLLSNEERYQLLVEWNQTHTPLPSRQTIHQLFEASVDEHPDQIAVVFEEQRLSYAELNAKANNLAHYLRAHGVGADELVGIYVERSLDMVVAVLAVLKAGGAYLPLDPMLPRARMMYMLHDAKPLLLLTQSHLLDRLPQMAIEHVCLDRDAALFSTGTDHNPSQRTRPDHLAYVIYTSGSTGKPKGTLIHHRGLVNLVLAQQEAFDLQPGRRVLQWASFNFDASVSEIFTALTAGARLYLAPSEAVLPGRNLLETLRRHHIELVTLTPSSLSALPIEPLPELKTLVVAGENCDHALIAPWLKRYTVINAYGPTEATVCATVYSCAEDGQRHPPIGRPIANTQTYILDAYLHPVPIGVTGELYLGGEGLARGYLGRPDLTAERFIQNPFSGQPGARMYQTGDLARYRADGQIEYIGRIDHQVKIRGYRVELGEIEFALSQLPSIREAVVLAKDAPAGGQRLVAYVVQDADVAGSDAAASRQLREALHCNLPDYMAPAHFVFLDHLPVNTNGKIDRTALDALGWVEDELVYAPPCTSTEERLAAIWSELLTRKRVGRDENFFLIGGHSLLAVRLAAQVNEAFRLTLPLTQFFMSPTIATLAAAILTDQTKMQLVVPMKQGTANEPPIWLIHPAGGTVFCYRKLIDQFDTTQSVFAIQSPEIAGIEFVPDNFDTLCQRYTSEILRMQADDPIYLAGWSMGGALAFRIADFIEQAGRHVKWVALFDTMLANTKASPSFEEFIEWAFTNFQADALSPGDIAEAEHLRAAQYIKQHGAARLAHQLSVNPDYLTNKLGLNAHYVTFLRRQYQVQQAHVALMADFVPGKINAPLHVFRAEESFRGTLEMNWLGHTNAIQRSTQHTLPGRHENLIFLKENIHTIVELLANR